LSKEEVNKRRKLQCRMPLLMSLLMLINTRTHSGSKLKVNYHECNVPRYDPRTPSYDQSDILDCTISA
jgi:hypothetical protein